MGSRAAWEPTDRRPRWFVPAALVAVAVLVLSTARFAQQTEGAGRLTVDAGEDEPAAESAPNPEADAAERPPRTPEPDASAELVGGWRPLPPAPLQTRYDHTAVWADTCPTPPCGEMIVWGGGGASPEQGRAGAAYDPVSDSWRQIADAPRGGVSGGRVPGVWAGRDCDDGSGCGELIVWGALDHPGEPEGAAYDPATDTWRALPEAPVKARVDHSMLWTGREVLVWGGQGFDAGDRQARSPQAAGPAHGASTGGVDFADGAAYDPVTDTWRRLPPAPLTARHAHAAVWTGHGCDQPPPTCGEMIVWGGGAHGYAPLLVSGAAYDPATDTWRALPDLPLAAPPLDMPGRAAAVWTGKELVLIAPLHASTGAAASAVYEPAEDRWRLLLDSPAGARSGAQLLWTGPPSCRAHGQPCGEVIVWGGSVTPRASAAGVNWNALYDPATDSWRRRVRGAYPRTGDSVVWTGEEMLVWGGWNHHGGPDAQGAAYRVDAEPAQRP